MPGGARAATALVSVAGSRIGRPDMNRQEFLDKVADHFHQRLGALPKPTETNVGVERDDRVVSVDANKRGPVRVHSHPVSDEEAAEFVRRARRRLADTAIQAPSTYTLSKGGKKYFGWRFEADPDGDYEHLLEPVKQGLDCLLFLAGFSR